MSVRQYVISDPPIITFRQYIKDTNGIPSVVWQQQMEKAYIKTYKEVHNDRPDRYYDFDYTKDFETQFLPLPNTEAISEETGEPQQQEDYEGQHSRLDESTFLLILVEKEGEPSYITFPPTLDSNSKGGCYISQWTSEN